MSTKEIYNVTQEDDKFLVDLNNIALYLTSVGEDRRAYIHHVQLKANVSKYVCDKFDHAPDF